MSGVSNLPSWLVKVAKFSSPFVLFALVVLYARSLDGFAGIGWVALGFIVSGGLLVSFISSEFSPRWFVWVFSFFVGAGLLWAGLVFL